jgi:hypothetical protein
MNHIKSRSMHMEVLDVVYNQFFLHHKSLKVTANHITGHSPICTADVSAGGGTYSFCAVGVCPRKGVYIKVF